MLANLASQVVLIYGEMLKHAWCIILVKYLWEKDTPFLSCLAYQERDHKLFRIRLLLIAYDLCFVLSLGD